MQQLQKGDAIMQEVTGQIDLLGYELETLFTDYAFGENTEAFGVNLKVADYRATARRLAEMSREAQADFDKALAVPGAGGCAEYVSQAKAALEQVERIPAVADRAFKAMDALANLDTLVGEKALETSLYKASRSLIQITVETDFAAGYADYFAGRLGLRAGQTGPTRPATKASGSYPRGVSPASESQPLGI